MKKLLLVIITICSLFVFTGCEINFNTGGNTPTTEGQEKYTISFNTFNLTEAPTPIKDVTFIPSALPKLEIEGYDFFGWYYDSSFSKKALPADLISSDITLFAKFVEKVVEQTPTGPVVTPTPNIPTDTPTVPVTPTPEVTPTPDDTNKLVSSQTCTHTFVNNECSKCETDYDQQVFNIFKSNTIIYDNDSSNPYNVNLDLFGSDVKVIFYEADTRRDIYTNTTKEQFYSNYSIASSYEEAYFRTRHNFMSGDITNQGYLAPSGKVMTNGSAVRCTTAIYILDYQGNYLGYIPNNYNGDNRVIWYGGAYISFDDVAAYLYAFGEVPANSNYDKGTSGRKQSIAAWGKYGRVNIGEFYANTSKYPFQPNMPRSNSQKYTETDFGTQGGYRNYNTITGTSYSQSVYNNGSSISRGAARFCFVSNKKNVDQRYVFYTYNHYNDFQEYLNYDGGFGVRFGNESAGNQYCSDASDYNASNKFPITQYQSIALKTFNDLLNLV